MKRPPPKVVPYQWPSWLAPLGLVAIYLLFNIFFSPFVRPANFASWLSLLSFGMFLVEPILFGTWAAIGTGVVKLRIPATWSLLVAINFSPLWFGTPIPGISNPFEPIVMLTAVCVGWTLLLLLIAKVTHWSIDSTPIQFGSNETGQFSLRFLLGVTTVCAIVLGVGRGLITSESLAGSQVVNIVRGIVQVLVLTYTATILPFAILSISPRKPLFIALSLWPLLSILTSAAYLRFDTTTFLWGQLTLNLAIQTGALVASVACAIVLRFAGYRLIRRASTSPSP